MGCCCACWRRRTVTTDLQGSHHDTSEGTRLYLFLPLHPLYQYSNGFITLGLRVLVISRAFSRTWGSPGCASGRLPFPHRCPSPHPHPSPFAQLSRTFQFLRYVSPAPLPQVLCNSPFPKAGSAGRDHDPRVALASAPPHRL